MENVEFIYNIINVARQKKKMFECKVSFNSYRILNDGCLLTNLFRIAFINKEFSSKSNPFLKQMLSFYHSKYIF